MKAAAALLPLALAGCDLSMRDQPRTGVQERATLWPGGPSRSHPPAGTVALDQPARALALAMPPHVTPALLVRGEERYRIYCIMCHGARGRGDGIVVQRGFPHPPSFHQARLVAAGSPHVVDVVTRGYGVMYSYADRVNPADRWAIAAYVRALQAAGPAR